MTKLAIFIMIIVTYFLAQTLVIISKKWRNMTLVDRVWSLETLIITILVFCMSCDILLDHRFKSYNESNIRGELFGFSGGTINKDAHNAYFRGRIHLKKIRKNYFGVEEHHDNRGGNVARGLKNHGGFGGLKNENLNLFKTLNYVDEYENLLKLDHRIKAVEELGVITISGCPINRKFPHPFAIEDDVQTGAVYQDFTKNKKFNGINVLGSFKMENSCRKSRRPSWKSEQLIKEYSDKCSKRIKINKVALMLMCWGMDIVPMLNIVNYFVQGTEIVELKTSLLAYFPFTESSTPENVQQFVAVVFFEYLYLYLFFKLGMDMVTIALLSYSLIHTEIGLLIHSLHKFNDDLCGEGSDLDTNGQTLRERIMLRELNHLSEHHQSILSKIHKMCALITFRALYINGAICFELCIAIFLLVQGDYSFKIKYLMIAFCLVMILAQVSEDGQIVENGMEDIRHSFYALCWPSMSVRLQKSLLVVLTRCSKPTKITALNLFYINRMNLSTIIRASYSYFNLLNRLNMKQ